MVRKKSTGKVSVSRASIRRAVLYPAELRVRKRGIIPFDLLFVHGSAEIPVRRRDDKPGWYQITEPDCAPSVH